MTQMPAFARRWQICQKPAGPGHQGRPAPRKWFDRIEDARAAAQALASETGRDFVVLQTVETVKPADAQEQLL
ncbi:hypothetical protein PVW47_01555 [Marinovum sp. SP66]|uniref:hypothetical protein n=1 Tax=Marinovum TaxID=367771 RepID=UPI00237A3655|nr:hypothetical protein [Marinovum sp. SP66]MDD9738459.1 hypothetical protein [Marinovum sp. SP66]